MIVTTFYNVCRLWITTEIMDPVDYILWPNEGSQKMQSSEGASMLGHTQSSYPFLVEKNEWTSVQSCKIERLYNVMLEI